MKNILVIQSSARVKDSLSRQTTELLLEKLAEVKSIETRFRDLETTALPMLDAELLAAFYGQLDNLSEAQKNLQFISDELISELQWADQVVIAAPMYNFSVPARLKAWIDLVCRAGRTFNYTEKGPVGLLEDKKAYLIISTGGVPIGAPVDFSSGYLKQIMNFVGIQDVELIRVDGSNKDAQATLMRGREQIEQLLAA